MEGEGVVVGRGLDGRTARVPVSPFMLTMEVSIFGSLVLLYGSRRGLDGTYG